MFLDVNVLHILRYGTMTLEIEVIKLRASYLEYCCEAQARARQGLARDGPQGEKPQSLNPCLELTLKLVNTFHHHHPPTGHLI